MCCISFDSYIKPQPKGICIGSGVVVYLLIPTSNHNVYCFLNICSALYIFWFLHQTTTSEQGSSAELGCISFDSYIKPQLVSSSGMIRTGCISFDSYIKPQLEILLIVFTFVVYLLIPTSNHNKLTDAENAEPLYIFWFLHQTTTCRHQSFFCCLLYIFWFLHQTTTCSL